MHTPILIIDYGSQYTSLIARRIRMLGVYCEIHPSNISFDFFKQFNPCGVILSGGPSSVLEENPRVIPEWLFESQIPLLGVCYGMQAMAQQLGGKVIRGVAGEYGHADLHRTSTMDALFAGILQPGQQSIPVWMSHGDQVQELPPGFEKIAYTDHTTVAAMAHESKPWYGLQFHPEVNHTPSGLKILEQFVLSICQAQRTWRTDAVLENLVEEIRRTVGKDKVLLAL
ncbi:MAG: glutamine-hydrolyzing GMP synthase, partial [Legionellaceae bacterium]|nr:glutamine-hydrolyzing GMP synthase [Legionellaceae bacterium]